MALKIKNSGKYKMQYGHKYIYIIVRVIYLLFILNFKTNTPKNISSVENTDITSLYIKYKFLEYCNY